MATPRGPTVSLVQQRTKAPRKKGRECVCACVELAPALSCGKSDFAFASGYRSASFPASGAGMPKMTGRTPSQQAPPPTMTDNVCHAETIRQETPSTSKITAIQLAGKSRSLGNVFQRRRKDATMHLSCGGVSGSSRSPGASADVPAAVILSTQNMSPSALHAHAIIPVSPFKQVRHAHASRARGEHSSEVQSK